MGRARALLTYSATRLGLAPLMLWLIASLVFLLLRLAPGDPVDAVLGSRAPAAAKAAMRARLGLDQSLLQQYLDYLGDFVVGPECGRGIHQVNETGNHEVSGSAAMAAAQVAEPAHRIGGAQLKPDFFPGLATGSVASFKIAWLAAASWKSHLP